MTLKYPNKQYTFVCKNKYDSQLKCEKKRKKGQKKKLK